MMKIIKDRPANSDYDFKINPAFSAEAHNPVIRADADNPVFKCETQSKMLSPEAWKRLEEAINAPAEPSQQLIDLMNRKPRYEKSF